MQLELLQIRDHSRKPLRELASRFTAIDAKDYTVLPSESEIETYYSLADHLYVEPQPAISAARIDIDQRIQMTRQEMAVALSHIEVWKRIASSQHEYALVLEDDVCFHREFAKITDRAWADLRAAHESSPLFDILFLSYKEVRTRARKADISDFVFRLFCGVWYLSGYVLSRRGAQNLLKLLPVRGPVDLWMNLQFEKLNVFATSKSVINQRLDNRSDNSYSILPVLSKLGILENEKPILLKSKPQRKPVFATGSDFSRLTSLAMAISMLGYRCCSDINELPKSEYDSLFSNNRARVFDAYVNVGSLNEHFNRLANIYPSARFIITVDTKEELVDFNHDKEGDTTDLDDRDNIHRLIRRFRQSPDRLLILPNKAPNKWKLICEFLGCVLPISEYPNFSAMIQRRLYLADLKSRRADFPKTRKLMFDTLPWIAVSRGNWIGVPFERGCQEALADEYSVSVESFKEIDRSSWLLRDDTFPSNLALFKSSNFVTTDDGAAELILCKECLGVRNYSSASITSNQKFLYGSFEATLKVPNVPGVITGIFLHRNSPRQEIDIELLGKDPTKILLNVYYNPGDDGARLEYGYRGTPVLINLGFNASEGFHRYRIEWGPQAIRWFVDERLVHERYNWEPTPIPHLPMQFHVNLWPSRSVELAGRLSDRRLPTITTITTIFLKSLLSAKNDTDHISKGSEQTGGANFGDATSVSHP